MQNSMLPTAPPSPEYTSAPPQSGDVLKRELLINSRRTCADLDDYLRRVKRIDNTRNAFSEFYRSGEKFCGDEELAQVA